MPCPKAKCDRNWDRDNISQDDEFVAFKTSVNKRIFIRFTTPRRDQSPSFQATAGDNEKSEGKPEVFAEYVSD